MRQGLNRPGANPFVDEMTHEVLGELLGRRAFSLDEVDFHRIATADQMLAVALEFEQDTVLFYEILIGFVSDGGVRAQLETIIAEERRHIQCLRQKQGLDP
jgi:rubrerythrin